MLTKIRQRLERGAKAWASSVTAGGDHGWTQIGGMGTMGRLLAGSNYDYKRAAGPLYDNSIVLACIKWQGRVFPDAPAVVQRRDADGKWRNLPEHDLARMAEEPNPWYDGCTLLQATLLSLAIDGNGYWFKLRSRSGKLVGWQYVPHFRIRPFHAQGDPNPLSGFKLRAGGQERILDPAGVLHFRDGIHPEDELCGLSPLSGVLREVCTDNEAATFSAALLRNMCMPGVIISPKGGPEITLSTVQVNTLKEMFKSKFGGENRGEPFIHGIPIDITAPGFSPEQMVLDKVRDIPEERITSALGIPAVVAGLGAGLAAAGDRNLEAMERWAWRHNIVPTQRLLAIHITTDARREGLLGPNERFAFDNSAVSALQEDENDRYKRLTSAVGGPWLTPNEARAQAGQQPVDGGDVLYPPRSVAGLPEPGDPSDPKDPKQ